MKKNCKTNKNNKRNKTKKIGGASLSSNKSSKKPRQFSIVFTDKTTTQRRGPFVANAYNGKTQIGEFSIQEKNNNTWDMNISVEDEFQGINLAAELIRILTDYCLTHGIFSNTQKLYIDANANPRFWVSKLQMIPNPTYNSGENTAEGSGYEMVMTFKQLYDWAHSKTVPTIGSKKTKTN